ncbi:MAG: GPW/gp25 family protein [Oceanospirillaceae bacterium]
MENRDISFSLFGLDAQQRLPWASDAQSINQVIWNILLTSPGERLMRPEFGAGLKSFLHHPNNQTTRSLIEDIINESIRRWETRINVLQVSVNIDSQQLHQLVVDIHYQQKNNTQQQMMQFSLALNE